MTVGGTSAHSNSDPYNIAPMLVVLPGWGTATVYAQSMFLSFVLGIMLIYSPVNHPPIAQSAVVGTTVSPGVDIPITATDPDGDSLQITFLSGVNGIMASIFAL